MIEAALRDERFAMRFILGFSYSSGKHATRICSLKLFQGLETRVELCESGGKNIRRVAFQIIQDRRLKRGRTDLCNIL